MRRALLSLALLLVGCDACARLAFRQPEADHHVRVLWVIDSVMAQLQTAANDSIESMFQVTQVGVGPLSQPSEPGDSAYLIMGIVPCHAELREAGRVRATCPNPHAPTIHIHPHVGDFSVYGNNCSPSRPDYLFQLQRRHEFDAIICGANTRPTAFWYADNPLLGTKDFPRSRKPYGGDSAVVKVNE